MRADTLEELVKGMQDVNPQQFLATVREFNAAVKREVTVWGKLIREAGIKAD